MDIEKLPQTPYHEHNGSDNTPPIKASNLAGAPITHIASATGGSNVDSEARTAINALLAALKNLGLMK